jgi:hypothetical protein
MSLPMSRLAVLAVTAATAAVLAAGAVAVDVFVFGAVTGRVPGKNQARVAVRWDFECLGGKLGAATYEYTLQAVKLGTTQKVKLREGTSEKGTLTTTLGPGSWQLQADPFLCETERGAGSTDPEIGQTVPVPDFCTWVVTRARGAAELEQGAAVKRVRAGTVVAPGATVVTRAGGSLSLGTAGKDAAAEIGASSRVGVDPKQCGSSAGGWKLALGGGTLAVSAKKGPDAKRPHSVTTPNATSTAGAATWVVTTGTRGGAPVTVVAVRAGSVKVAGAGRSVTVRSGFRTTVSGRKPPAPPARG